MSSPGSPRSIRVFPHPGEPAFGEVFAVAGQQVPHVPLAVARAATPAPQLGGGPAADLIECLVGQLHDMKMIDNNGGVREGQGDPGREHAAHVDGHGADLRAPCRAPGIEPVDHGRFGASLDLPE
jgi:hypothetical protein